MLEVAKWAIVFTMEYKHASPTYQEETQSPPSWRALCLCTRRDAEASHQNGAGEVRRQMSEAVRSQSRVSDRD